jgi:hypothetical protein
MRKKQWFILLVLIAIITAFVVYEVCATPSAPFEQAKTLALTSSPDGDGDCIFGKKLIEKDVQVIYLVGYFPRLKVISGAVATIEKMVTVIYSGEIDTYGITVTDMQTGKVLVTKSISPNEASDMMDNILKHLINTGVSF